MIVFKPHYDFRVPGLAALHPFDGTKFSKAWAEAVAEDTRVATMTCGPASPASDHDLRLVHSGEYLDRVRNPVYAMHALEAPVWPVAVRALSPLVAPLLDQRILLPMRWATAGTVAAARGALRDGLAMNVGGGYHHASPECGEGFCLYADVPIAIAVLRRQGALAKHDRVLIVDLDAHQGNGFERCFIADPSVTFLDVFNADIYPQDTKAEARIDRAVRLRSGTPTAEYLETVALELDRVLSENAPPRLAFYIAGTDVLKDDALGGLSVSADGVMQRDRLVVDRLLAAEIATTVVTGGGYSTQSKHLVAALVRHVAAVASGRSGRADVLLQAKKDGDDTPWTSP